MERTRRCNKLFQITREQGIYHNKHSFLIFQPASASIFKWLKGVPVQLISRLVLDNNLLWMFVATLMHLRFQIDQFLCWNDSDFCDLLNAFFLSDSQLSKNGNYLISNVKASIFSLTDSLTWWAIWALKI